MFALCWVSMSSPSEAELAREAILLAERNLWTPARRWNGFLALACFCLRSELSVSITDCVSQSWSARPTCVTSRVCKGKGARRERTGAIVVGDGMGWGGVSVESKSRTARWGRDREWGVAIKSELAARTPLPRHESPSHVWSTFSQTSQWTPSRTKRGSDITHVSLVKPVALFTDKYMVSYWIHLNKYRTGESNVCGWNRELTKSQKKK